MRLLARLALTVALALAGARADEEHPVIAVGDLHGDLFHSVATLYSAGVLDLHGHWAAGARTVVQVGDVVDRGDDARFLYDLLAELREEAALHGGRLVQLLGNHEIMNFMGQLHYVSPGDVKQFGGHTKRAEEWRADGRLGYLRHLPIVFRHEDTVFVHAGLKPEWAKQGVDHVNHLAWEAIRAEQWRHPVLAFEESPVWTRDLVFGAQRGRCGELRQSLEALSEAEGRPVRRMVIGHTIQNNGRVGVLCGGALLAIDIAISRGCAGGYAGAVLLGEATAPPRVVPDSPLGFPRAVVAHLTERVRARLCRSYRQRGLFVPAGCPEDGDEF